MDDKNFDKIFQRKLNALPGIPASAAQWKEMSDNLDMHDNRYKKWLVPFLLFLIAFLSGLNIWSFHQGRQNATVQQMLLIKRDTIIQTTTIFRYDTIYIHSGALASTRINGLYTSQMQKNNAISPRWISSVHPSKNTDEHSVQTVSPIPDTTQNSVLPVEENIIISALKMPQSNTNVDPYKQKDALEHPDAVHTHQDTINDIIITKPNDAPTKIKRAPRLFFRASQMGISFGRSTPIIKGFESGEILQSGLVANFEIMRKFRLEAGVQYQNVRMKSETPNALANIVMIPSPGSDYNLKYWEIHNLPIVSYMAQLRYQLGTWFHISPYIGFGGQLKTVFPYEIEYEFENAVNDLELNEPGATNARTSWQGFTHQFGLERNAGKRYALAVEGVWLRNWGQSADIFSQYWGVNARLLYNF